MKALMVLGFAVILAGALPARAAGGDDDDKLSCSNSELSVDIERDDIGSYLTSPGKELVSIWIVDFSGHGLNYVADVPEHKVMEKLGEGFKAENSEVKSKIDVVLIGSRLHVSGGFRGVLDCHSAPRTSNH